MRFDIESWIWYTFAVGIIVARLTSRTLLFGSLKGLQYDDWIMGIFVTTCYTVLIVMTNVEAKSKSNLLSPGFDIDSLSAQDILAREYGSKIVVVVEQMQIAVIWACKSCLLILYHRLTRMVASKENVAIKLLAVYVALGFIVMEALYFAAWCRPFRQYWAVPTMSTQCNALTNHRITNAVFNISSDLVMLCIALPMFIRSLLPLKRKIILCFIFSLGIFVILAAILNKYYSFSNPYEPTWIFWYARESSTAILVANLPFTWTILRKMFNLGAFDEEHPPPPTYHSSRTAGGRRTARVHNHQGFGTSSTDKYVEGSTGTKNSHSMSLIGSICAGKSHLSPPTTRDGDNSISQNSQKALLGDRMRAQNSTTLPPPDVRIDLEAGPSLVFPPECHISPPNTRPASPLSPPRPARVSFDGTGGFFVNGRLASPRRAQLASAAPSRDSSAAPNGRRPSATPSLSPSVASCASAGGGRSARDRKIRSRMSK